MLLLLSAALAHVPHDKVSAVVTSEDGPWLAIANPGRQSLILVSLDEGLSWDLVGGAPTAEELYAADHLSDGSWVLLGEAHVWVSGDRGRSWSIVDVPGEVDQLAVYGDDVLLAGPAGSWEGPALGPYAMVGREGEAVSLVGAGTMVYADGGLQVRGEEWHEVSSPGPPTTSALVSDGVLYAAAGSGQVWYREDGAWLPCTVLDSGSDFLRLYPGDGAIYVTAKGHALWRSTDHCASWEDLRAPLEAEYGVSGGVESTAEAFPVVQEAGDRLVVAGWAGLAVLADDAWAVATILPAGYTRGLIVSPEFASDGRIWWGTYAGGIARSDDGGASWEAPNLGSLDPNIQSLALDRDGSTLYAISGHILRRSTDEGRIWDTLRTGFSADESIIIWQEPGHVWATGRSGEGIESTEVRETFDYGDTWSPVGLLSSSVPGADARAVTRVLESLCVSTSDRSLLCSDDNGATWASRFSGNADLGDPVAWPKGEPRRILVVDDDGVHWSDDAGGSWTLVVLDPLDPPAILVAAPEDSLYLLTASGRLWRSADGGESWGATGLRVPADTFHLVPRPDFVAHPELIAGTADGLYVIEEARGSPSLRAWAPWERVEASGTEFGRCTDCPTPRDWPGAGTVDVQPLDPAGTWQTALRGRHLRVTGATLGVASFRVRVDGVVVATGEDLWDPNVHELAAVDLGEDGWHRVVVSGENLLLDAVEAQGTLDPLPGVDPGCATRRGAPVTLAALAGMLLTRRRGRC